MNKEVATKGTTAVGAPINFSFGADNLISQDIRLPKILLMQAMSDYCLSGKARPGELVESFEGSKLGDRKTPVQIIPFYFTNTWTVKKLVNGKYDFHAIEDRGGSDIRREYKEVKDGVEYSNHRTLNIFALIKNGNTAVPYMISFMNSSFKSAAQPFLNKTQLIKAEGKAPAHYTWNLGVDDDGNDKGKWVVFTLETAKDDNGKDIPNTNEEVQAAYMAYKSITDSLSSGAKIDMSDVAGNDGEQVPF